MAVLTLDEFLKRKKKDTDTFMTEIQNQKKTTNGVQTLEEFAQKKNLSTDSIYGGLKKATQQVTQNTLTVTSQTDRSALQKQAEQNVAKQFGTYEEFAKKNSAGKVGVVANATTQISQTTYKKLIEEETNRLASGSEFYGITNEGYREYLDNFSENATDDKQKKWLETQKQNLEALKDSDVRTQVEQAVYANKTSLRKNAGSLIHALSQQLQISYEQAESLYDTVEREQNAKHSQTMLEKADELTEKGVLGKAGAQLLSVGANMTSTLSFLDSLLQNEVNTVKGDYEPLDTNSFGYMSGKFRDRARGNIEADIEGEDGSVLRKGLGILYQGATSSFDSLSQGLLLGPTGGLTAMASQAAGSSTEEAFERTGSNTKAFATGLTSGLIEAATEKMGLDNMWDILQNSGKAAMRSELVNVLGQMAIEAGEEMTSEVANTIADRIINTTDSNWTKNKQSYMDSGMSEQEAFKKTMGDTVQQVLLAGAGGAAGGLFGGISSSLLSTSYTKNEQKVIDAEVDARVAEKAKDGKVSAKQKSDIRKAVESDLAKGYIGIDTIEKTLGGDTLQKYNSIVEQEETLSKQIKELGEKPNTVANAKQYEELSTKLKELQEKGEKNTLKEQLSKEVSDLTVNDRLLRESYNEKGRRAQSFQADVSQYQKNQQDTIQRAIDSGVLNNTNRTHEFVDLIAKISAEKGVSFDFTNNEKLKESGFAREGVTVNGYVDGENVVLNVNSAKALNQVVGHEITHVLEGSEFYAELQETLKAYATTKGEYQSKLEALTKLYEGMEGVNIEQELTADLIGEYLFTDEAFVQQLSTQNRNIFQKIYDEIKYLLKMVTAGSKEARQLEKVKKVFEEAYRDNAKANRKEKLYSLHVNQNILQKAEQFKKEGYKKFERVKVLDVTPRINNEVARLIGFDATGYEIYSNTDTYKHIENRHGENGKHDQSMADMRDVALMGYVLEEFDSAELVLNSKGEADTTNAYVDKDGKPAKMIKFSKEIEGVQHVVIATPENKYKKLWVLSEYIERNKKDTSQTSYDKSVLPPTPKANSDNVSLEGSISQNQQNATENKKFSISGVNARTAESSLLLSAEHMLDSGVDSETVRQETGWYRGYDGKMRFEIDDSESDLIENPILERHIDDGETYFTGKLSDVLKHDKLYAAYPELQDMKIIIQETEPGVQGISFKDSIVLSQSLFQRYTKDYQEYLDGGRKAEIERIEQSKEYQEYNKYYEDEELQESDPERWLEEEKRARDKFFSSELGKRYHQLKWGKYNGQKYELGWSKQAKKVLMHEIQHSIQDIENFTLGSSEKYWQRRINEGHSIKTIEQREELAKLEEEYRKIAENEKAFFDDMMMLEDMAPDIPRGKFDFDTFEQIEEDPIEWQEYDRQRDELEEKYGDDKCWNFFNLTDKLRSLREKSMSASDAYWRTAGEIEARDTENRIGLTEEQRKGKRPDIDSKEVVLREDYQKFSLSKNGMLMDESGNEITLETSEIGHHGTLMAIRNINEAELRGMLELGGIPVPSIAITDPSKVDHSNFGSISVLFDKETIDPANGKNEVYDRDVWSSRFPTLDYEMDETKANELYKRARETGHLAFFNPVSLAPGNLENKMRHGAATMIEDLKNDYGMKNFYLAETSHPVENIFVEKRTEISQSDKEMFEYVLSHMQNEIAEIKNMTGREWNGRYGERYNEVLKDYWRQANPSLSETEINSLVESKKPFKRVQEVSKIQDYSQNGGVKTETIEDSQATKAEIDKRVHQKDYERWLEEYFAGIEKSVGIPNGKDPYTASGNQRSFRELHDSYTLENLVKNMTKGRTTGSENALFGVSAGAISSNMATKFDSISDIKNAEGRISANADEMIKPITDRLYENINNLNKYYKGDSYNLNTSATEAIFEFSTKKLTESTLRQILNDYYFAADQIPRTELQAIINSLNELRDIPSDYFEAKPQRAVGLDEIQAIVLPNDTDIELKQELSEKGFYVIEYEQNLSGDRQNKINQFDDLKFSLSENDSVSNTDGWNVRGEDLALEDIGPVRKDMETTQENAQIVREDDIFGVLQHYSNDEEKNILKGKNRVVLKTKGDIGKFVENAIQKTEQNQFGYLGVVTSETIDNIRNQLTDISDENKQELLKRGSYSLRIGQSEIRHMQKSGMLIQEVTDYVEKIPRIVSEFDSARYTIENHDGQVIHGIRFEKTFDDGKMYSYLMVSNKKGTFTIKTTYMERNDYNKKKHSLLPDTPQGVGGYTSETGSSSASTNSIPQSTEKSIKNSGKFSRSEYHKSLVDNIKSEFQKNGYDFDKVLGNAKNKSVWSSVDNTPQRFIQKTFGYKQGEILNDLTVNKVAQNETEGIRWLNGYTDRKNGLIAKISKQYNIKPGSKESAAAMMYGEGFYVNRAGDYVKYGDAELAKDFIVPEVQNNIKNLAKDPRIRKIYDDTLQLINEARRRNGYEEIPRRKDYFLHYQAMGDTFSKIGIPFNSDMIKSNNLPTDLNGVTVDLKPGQPYFASSKQRQGVRTTYDLLGGLERYLVSAKNQIFHIDDIQTLRALRNYIADTYGQAKGLENLDEMSEVEAEQRIKDVFNGHLSNFASFLTREANTLAGKTALIDRAIEGIFGRKGITILNTINQQVGSNMVGGNVSSAMTNFGSAVIAMAKGKKSAVVKSLAQTVTNRIGAITRHSLDNFTEENSLCVRRKGAEKFYQTPYDKIKNIGFSLAGLTDDICTEFIARVKYNELISKGVDESVAHYEADKWGSKILGDRSYGQQPLLFNSKILGLITKFQLEVRNNLDNMFYDTIQETKLENADIQNQLKKNAVTVAKATATILQLMAFNHIFGKSFEKIVGYNPTLDLIEIIMTLFGMDDEEDSEDDVLDNAEQALLALLDDLPYSSALTGGRIPISAALPVTELINGTDQYGNEQSRVKTVAEALPYYIFPTGYGQLKKSIQGLRMFDSDLPVTGSYTNNSLFDALDKNSEKKEQKLRFPVEDTVGNRIKAGLFGQYANENAQAYFDEERSPLSEKKTQEFAELDIPISEYWSIQDGLKGMTKIGEKADYIANLDLPVEKKNLLINNRTTRKDPIDLTDYSLYNDLEEMDFAIQNPGKYSIAKALGGYETYQGYQDTLNSIYSNKDKNGNAISGSRKEKVIDYLNGLKVDYGTRMILYRQQYSGDSTYNQAIVEYLDGRSDLSYTDKEKILTELGFTVESDGTVRWKN